MKKDLRMLDELRKGPLAGMDEDEFKMIEADVRKFGFKGLSGYAKSMVMEAMRRLGTTINKAVEGKLIEFNKSISVGDKVSWNSSGGSAEGKVLRIERSGKINVPDSSFEIEGTEDDPAALIVLYRDGKPTDTKVGHKVSTLKKKQFLRSTGTMTNQVMATGAMPMILKVKIHQNQKTQNKILFHTMMTPKVSLQIQITMTQNGWTQWITQERRSNAKRY